MKENKKKINIGLVVIVLGILLVIFGVVRIQLKQ